MLNFIIKNRLIKSVIYSLLLSIVIFIPLSFILETEATLYDYWDSIGIIYIYLHIFKLIISLSYGMLFGIFIYLAPKYIKNKEISEWKILFGSLIIIPTVIFFSWSANYKIRTSMPESEVSSIESIYEKDAHFFSPPCSWIGVKCSWINGTMRITSLSLYTEKLSTKTVPKEISQLTALEHLSIRPESNLGNYTDSVDGLIGTIPQEIFTLTKLRSLEIKGMEFEGSIPNEIGNLKELEVLVLRDSGFSGEIPSSIGTLPKLEKLDLSKNLLSGAIPESIYSLEKLNSLELDSNSLSGSISKKIESLKELEFFSIRYNSFDGKLPKNIENLPKLEAIWLADSGLCFNYLDYSRKVFSAIIDDEKIFPCK